ncbi:hypothetical protein [Spirosoma flavum]
MMTATCAHAQVEYNTVQNIRIYAPAFTPYNTVDGSPYVPSDTVQNGWLVNGKKRMPAKLRYNTYTGVVEYVQDGKLLTPITSIAEFAILAADTMHFQKGFPATQERSVNDFYQILFDGRKTKLVKYISATIKTNTDAMHDDFGKKKFQFREAYYVWVANGALPSGNSFLTLSEGEMKSVLASKKSLITALPQKAEPIEHYVADQKIKVKSWAEFARVLSYLEMH